ncbi:hypothetical protein BH11PAT4_BH11PAT4_0630 [soil metagenome]
MRKLLLIVGVGMGVVLTLLLVLIWRTEHLSKPMLDGERVVIQSDGQLTQGGTFVGLARGSGGQGALAVLPLVGVSDEAQVTGSLEVTFPKKAREVVQVSPSSIEGSDVVSINWVGDSLLRVTTIGALAEGHPSIIIGFPEGYLQPGFVAGILQDLENFPILYWLLICVAILLLVFGFAYVRTRPINFTQKGESLPNPPGDLRPIELALLHHGVLRPTDLAALFYNLAERGYLEIIDHGDETDEVLFLRSKQDEGLTIYERNFLLLLFTKGMKPIRFSEVLKELNEELFSAVVSQLYVEVYDSFAARGFFRDSPRAIHLRYKTCGIILQSIAVFLAFLVLFGVIKTFPALLVLSGTLYVAGALTFRIGYRVVPFSRLGWELASKAAGFVRYLRDSQPFVWGVGPDSEIFYRYVPFSLVAAEVAPWYARFSNYKRWAIPDWYTDIDDILVTPERFVAQVGVVAQILGEALSNVRDPNVD